MCDRQCVIGNVYQAVCNWQCLIGNVYQYQVKDATESVQKEMWKKKTCHVIAVHKICALCAWNVPIWCAQCERGYLWIKYIYKWNMENQHHHIVYHCFTLRANASSNRSSLRYALFLLTLRHIVEKDQCNTGTQGNKHRSTFATKKPSSFFTATHVTVHPRRHDVQTLAFCDDDQGTHPHIGEFGRWRVCDDLRPGFATCVVDRWVWLPYYGNSPRTIIFLEIYVQV